MRYSIERIVKRILLMATDSFLIFMSMLLATFTTHSTSDTIIHSPYILGGIILLHLIILTSSKVYSIRLIDSSLELVLRGGFAIILTSVVSAVGLLLLTKDFSIVFRTLLPFFSYTTLLLLGYRIIYRISQSYRLKSPTFDNSSKALIYGAGEIGMQLVRQHFKNKLQFSVAGFIDDNPIKKGAMINGVRVLGDIDQMSDVFRSSNIQFLIIAITNLSGDKMKRALDIAERFGIEVKIIPSLFEIESKKKNVADIRSINFEDMLGRSPVVLDREPIKSMVSGKRILVTGAGGSIGSEICRQLLEYDPKKLLLLDIDESELHDLSLRLHNYSNEFSEKIFPIVCDVRESAKVELIFKTYEPEIVFHAAALKHVPMMEYYPEEAVKTNIMGTYHVLKNAVKYKAAKCIVISTDKAVNPTNVMGATKRIAEKIARMLSTPETQIVAVRFGNVLGSRGSMLPLFLEQMRNGLPITVTDKKIIRYFMTIPEAVSLVFQAGSLGNGGEVMVLEMGDPVNIYEFANRLVKYFGDGRSKIVITGLRPGEKLYEEKLSDQDNTIPTDNPKVYKAKVNGAFDRETFEEFYTQIPILTPEEMITTLQKFVPEFTRPGRHVIG